MEETAPQEFRIGLALAGAISAGAYTAGVMDFLVQALEAWEAARSDPAIPQHRTGIKVIAGASAGAITGAMGVVALARKSDEAALGAGEIAASYRTPGQRYNPTRCILPLLYSTWVEKPRLVSAVEGGPDFLNPADLLAPDAVVGAALNSDLLTGIKDQGLATATPTAHTQRPYLAQRLHLYMTISNLRGIPYRIVFNTGTYGMQTHGDRAHYVVGGAGSWNCPDTGWAAGDAATTIDATLLPTAPDQPVPDIWSRYGTAALASSAFPIGLASREITAPYSDYKTRNYPIDMASEFTLQPSFPGHLDFAGDYTFLNVDGGLINNNPFDYAEYALLDRPALRRPERARDTDAALIMVAPFPDPPAFLPDGQPAPEIFAIIRALIPTLTTQARFRSADLAKAIDPENFSRYIIAPRRILPDDPAEQPYTIASGALGGFGGFLDENFRAHDYQLGRRNCQQFLRETFALPAGATRLDSKAAFRTSTKSLLPAQMPVIPLVGAAALEVALPHWPQISQTDLATINQRIALRLARLVPLLIRTQTTSLRLRLIGNIAFMVGKKRILETLRLAILSDLIRRDQVQDWQPGPIPGASPLETLAVLAELAAPGFAFRTLAGLAKSTHLPESAVATILAALPTGEQAWAVWRPGWNPALTTLKSRKPEGLLTWPGIAPLDRWFNPPRIG